MVIGDVMLDAYAWGFTERMSPEAPVPVVQIREHEYRPGGAANVALNLHSLGVQTKLLSIVGKDETAERLSQALQSAGIKDFLMLPMNDRPTTLKTRIMIGNQQLLRIDEEEISDIKQDIAEAFMEIVARELPQTNAIILQDYDKGLFSPELTAAIISLASKHQIPVAVDPKKRHFFDFKNVSLFKPNLKELCDGLGKPLYKSQLNVIAEAVEELRETLSAKAMLLTLSEAGVMYSSADEQGRFPAHLRSIADVSGAGDTVIAVAGCCLAAGLSLPDLAALSNLAGGLVCESLGVVPIKKDKLLAEAILNAN